ncbi:hypothetical protein GALMADRAFT_215894 [Galerina marginata CBS 339.88]|uniref:Uncharacterized protein n=1 Tax=Galerina marginata (strain CBS 339.88) TaxID=685588 RepID=A0A067SN29_GALM3|nr:hypothetical protein GALMADRAFT_215894 [Galerina marginata CBS 339.88]
MVKGCGVIILEEVRVISTNKKEINDVLTTHQPTRLGISLKFSTTVRRFDHTQVKLGLKREEVDSRISKFVVNPSNSPTEQLDEACVKQRIMPRHTWHKHDEEFSSIMNTSGVVNRRTTMAARRCWSYDEGRRKAIGNLERCKEGVVPRPNTADPKF